MGCDIHLMVEFRRKEMTGEYKTFAWDQLHLERTYEIFGRLAGVRRPDLEQVAPVRGIPPDIGWATQKEIDDEDGHAHSWVTPDEFEAAVTGTSWPCPEYIATLALMRSFEAQGYDCRAVFYFDN
jgi:hypothetical protein